MNIFVSTTRGPVSRCLPLLDAQVLREDFASLGVHPTVSSVSASEIDLAGDHRAWDVSWVSVPGDFMESANFSCKMSNISIAYKGENNCATGVVASSTGAIPISGTFALTVSSSYVDQRGDENMLEMAETTTPLAYNATSVEVQAALERLGTVSAADVELIKSLSGSRGGGSAFQVTFKGATGAASPMGGISMSISAIRLNGTRVHAAIREVHPGSRWGGEFALSFAQLEGQALPFNADAEQVREIIDTFVSSAGRDEGGVTVSREEVEAGFRWAVTFPAEDLKGNIDLMEVCAGYATIHCCRRAACTYLVCGC